MKLMRKKLRFVLIIIIQKKWKRFFDILKITIPSVIVFLTAWVLLRNMISMIRISADRKLYAKQPHNIAIRLQAYER